MHQHRCIWLNSFAVFMTISISTAAFAGWEESARVGEIFRNTEVNGTFVLYDAKADSFTGHNKHRAEKRFVPASTFKIPNSLIGLSVGAVKSVDEVLPYKSNVPPLSKAWERIWGCGKLSLCQTSQSIRNWPDVSALSACARMFRR